MLAPLIVKPPSLTVVSACSSHVVCMSFRSGGSVFHFEALVGIFNLSLVSLASASVVGTGSANRFQRLFQGPALMRNRNLHQIARRPGLARMAAAREETTMQSVRSIGSRPAVASAKYLRVPTPAAPQCINLTQCT